MTIKSSMLVSWGARAAYIGPGFELPAHRNSVAVLAVALQAPMRVAVDANDLEHGFESCSSLLIEPNKLHLLATSGQDHAFIYLDALSDDLMTLRTSFLRSSKALYFDLKNEREVIELLRKMRVDMQSWVTNQHVLAKALGFSAGQREPRIARVVQALQSCPDDVRGADDWAKEVGLSSSRFQHLFKMNMNLSFRRFRVWTRIRFALTLVMRGASLTRAAFDAGFSSSSHLSAAFKEMFGISLSQLVKTSPLYIEV